MRGQPVVIENAHIAAVGIRDTVEGFDHADCVTSPGDAVRHMLTRNGDRSMAEHEDKIVRLEIFLQNADLFTIVAE